MDHKNHGCVPFEDEILKIIKVGKMKVAEGATDVLH